MQELDKTLKIVVRFNNGEKEIERGIWLPKEGDKAGAKWSWNGSFEKPTIRASILCQFEAQLMHFFITDGVIENCGDGTPVKFVRLEEERE